MKKATLLFLLLYKKYISDTILRFVFPHPICRFVPTCSQYMYQAINRYGTIKGLFLGVKRIIRCHPLNKGGYDPVK